MLAEIACPVSAGLDAPDVTSALVRVGAPMPNPLRELSALPVALDVRATLRVDVFSADGRWIRDLANGVRDAGRHVVTWDGVSAAGRRVAPGVYVMRVRLDGRQAGSRTVVVVD